MRISRLRLIGFKSFTEPTELVIEPGLTGVVGPNGCGKSNLLEALRWVMGETSHKSMRASSMNDVIFSGTSARPARNWAEVTMFLDNSKREAPAEYNDTDLIEISRRIERDAGSAYRINGRESRAKDVKILFEDAATGARSPALVRQGQIGDIVNAKPEARRRILEDAAGIAGLHSRRHDAELRLNAAERNLVRLDDVLGGLTSQIESLKRQARQARRYKEISEQIRSAQALAMHLSWMEAQEFLAREEAELTEVLATLSAAVEAESQTLRAETAYSEKLQPLREEEATRSAVYGRLKVEAENFEREADRAMKRARELEERAEQFERDIAREENFAREAREIIARLENEVTENIARDETAQQASEGAKEEVAQAEQDLGAHEARLSELTRRFAEETARRNSQEATLAETQKAIGRLEKQLAAIDEDIAGVRSSAPDAEKHQVVAAESQRLSEQIGDVEQQTTQAEERLSALEGELKIKRDAATQARLSFQALETERETLVNLLAPVQGEAYPAIVDSLSVSAGYETALGAALGDDLDAPTADASPVRWTLVPAMGGDGALPSGVMKLSDVVQGPQELQRRLDQVGVVDRVQGAALQPQLLPGQRLVSREGDLWRWDGFVAACEGTTAAAQRLAQRNRMRALSEEIVALNAIVERCAGAEDDCVGVLAQAREDAHRLRGAWREMQTRQAQLRDNLSAMERVARDIESRFAALHASKTRSEQDLTQAREKAEEISQALAASGGERAQALQAELDDAQQSVQDRRAQAAKKQALLAGLEREHLIRSERIQAQKIELDRWRERSQSAVEQAETLALRLTDTRSELATLADLPAQMDARRQELFASVAAAEEARKTASDNVATAEAELKDATRVLREAQAMVSEARERRARIEALLESARERLGDEERRIGETLGVAPGECLSLAELPDDAEPPARDEVEHRLSRLKADRERLGGVNLQADDELTGLTEQRDSIEAERADVEQAIAKLRGGIGQLNREARKRLKEAFETVDAHFRRLFSILFDGGEARLEMIESEEDPLEGGLEIIARPPGKKPATLSLLSGGEQTLTALSLIFAVFLTNPSPICVLDEVDAPLDDANVDRFCTLMERMAQDTETRFLVITHHPMTMTRMNRLFGVTMAEKGISQLVSVDLETAQGFREAS